MKAFPVVSLSDLTILNGFCKVHRRQYFELLFLYYNEVCLLFQILDTTIILTYKGVGSHDGDAGNEARKSIYLQRIFALGSLDNILEASR